MTSDPHIFTLTGNLLAERTLEFAAWSPGRTHRASTESFQVGGKGINVSKMLNRLRVPNTALCFTGGAPGAECEAWLRSRGFNYRAFASDRPTRSGLVVRGASQDETTFLGPDTAPSPAAVEACASLLDAQPSGQILAICGSLPGWSTPEFDPLRAAFERWLTRGTLVVDSYGPPLAWFVERPLALVKINATELHSLLPNVSSVPEALAAAAARWPVNRWVISDGPRPVWMLERDHEPESLVPAPVREVSATGSGDVLLACILVALFRRHASLRDAVAQALPAASANAAHAGIAEFP